MWTFFELPAFSACFLFASYKHDGPPFYYRPLFLPLLPRRRNFLLPRTLTCSTGCLTETHTFTSTVSFPINTSPQGEHVKDTACLRNLRRIRIVWPWCRVRGLLKVKTKPDVVRPSDGIPSPRDTFASTVDVILRTTRPHARYL